MRRSCVDVSAMQVSHVVCGHCRTELLFCPFIRATCATYTHIDAVDSQQHALFSLSDANEQLQEQQEEGESLASGPDGDEEGYGNDDGDLPDLLGRNSAAGQAAAGGARRGRGGGLKRCSVGGQRVGVGASREDDAGEE